MLRRETRIYSTAMGTIFLCFWCRKLCCSTKTSTERIFCLIDLLWIHIVSFSCLGKCSYDKEGKYISHMLPFFPYYPLKTSIIN
jgi:hypothetical protein